jgi:integrase
VRHLRPKRARRSRPWTPTRCHGSTPATRGGLPTAKNERRYYERVWRPAVGRLALDAVKASHIQSVINDAASGRLLSTKGKRYSRESIMQMRAAILRMLESAWKEELLSENRAKRTEVPEIEETKKPRAVLTDAEIGLLLGHPHVDAELKLLILMSRTIGGMRTGDLNTLTWDAFDPEFTTCTFVRRKTRKKKPAPQALEVPEGVRPFIKAWWDVSKQPTSGPVFPVRRGERAGQVKAQSKQSYADRLRRNLRVAFGLDAWNGLTGRFDRVADREPTQRERELLDGSATVQAVDFHSTRRAYATSLARVGVNAQTAMALTGHSDHKVHQRYVEAASIRALPAAAIPYVNPSSTVLVANGIKPERVTKTGAKRKKPAETLSQPADFVRISGAGEEIRTLDVHLGKTIRTVSRRSGPLRNTRKQRKYELRRYPGVPTVTPKWGAKWGASRAKWGAS